jgi:hypothetical protein
MKKNYLTKAERSQFTLSDYLTEILVGCIMGDLYVKKQKGGLNPALRFEQGIVHKDYLFHLYALFNSYCRSAPKIESRLPDKLSGSIYTRVRFHTYSLPCFNELYELFYPNGEKVLPANIGELFTPLSLAYWLCDDGCFDRGAIIISTNSFSKAEVNLLINVLKNKFNLQCTINKQGSAFRIRISVNSLPAVQALLKDIVPPMMMHKIGL